MHFQGIRFQFPLKWRKIKAFLFLRGKEYAVQSRILAFFHLFPFFSFFSYCLLCFFSCPFFSFAFFSLAPFPYPPNHRILQNIYPYSYLKTIIFTKLFQIKNDGKKKLENHLVTMTWFISYLSALIKNLFRITSVDVKTNQLNT